MSNVTTFFRSDLFDTLKLAVKLIAFSAIMAIIVLGLFGLAAQLVN